MNERPCPHCGQLASKRARDAGEAFIRGHEAGVKAERKDQVERTTEAIKRAFDNDRLIGSGV